MKQWKCWAALAAAVVLVGCGGGGGGNGTQSNGQTGALTLNIVWPNRSRLIPLASNSIKVDISQNNTVVATQTIARPATQVTFQQLPAGSYTVTATAFPTNNGSGVGQALGSSTATVSVGTTSTTTVTMASTIDHIVISPTNPTILPGQTVQFTATAKDINNNTVVTLAQTDPNTTFSWKSADTTIATVDKTGLTTGVKGGVVAITVTETESTKSVSTNTTVNAGNAVINIQ